MPIWPSLPRALQALGVDPNSPLGRFNRRVKRTGRAIEELPELPEEALDWAIRAPDEELEMGPPSSLAPPLNIPTTGTAATPYGTDIGVPSRPPRRNRITGEMDIPESGMWWNWSDTGTTEPRPEEGQKWLQRAGAGMQLPLPLSDMELSERAYQFPNAGDVQEDWKLRQAENLAASNRAQQALDMLREAETETSPIVSTLRERQARQKAYPAYEQARGMIGQAEISGQYGEQRANVAAQAALQAALLKSVSQGDLAAARRQQGLLNAIARVGSLPQDDESRQLLKWLMDQAMQELGPEMLNMADEDNQGYDEALEGLLGAFR